MNLLEELENKSFRLNSKYEQQILQMYNEDLIKLKDANEIFSRFEQQVSLGASQPVLLAEDSKEYKLWCEIVTDITTYAGTDEGINIIEKIENLFGLDNKDNFNELEKKAVTHLNSLKNTWE